MKKRSIRSRLKIVLSILLTFNILFGISTPLSGVLARELTEGETVQTVTGTKTTDYSTLLAGTDLEGSLKNSMIGSNLTETINNFKETYLLGIASDFSIFLKDDLTVYDSDIEGRAAIGGTLYNKSPHGNYAIGQGDYLNHTPLTTLLGREGFASGIIGSYYYDSSKPNNENKFLGNIYYRNGSEVIGTDSDKLIVLNQTPTSELSSTDIANKNGIIFKTQQEGLYQGTSGYSNSAVAQEQTYTHKIIDFDSYFKELQQISKRLLDYSDEASEDMFSKKNNNGQNISTTKIGSEWRPELFFEYTGPQDPTEVVFLNLNEQEFEWYTRAGNIYFNNIPKLPTPRKVVNNNGTVSTWDYASIIINVTAGENTSEGDGYTLYLNNLYNENNRNDWFQNPGWIGRDSKNTYINYHQIGDYNNNPGVTSLLYNIPYATQVVLGINYQGTVFAPNADVVDGQLLGKTDNHGHLSGALIAKSFEGYTEFGYRPFASGIDDLLPGSLVIRKLITGEDVEADKKFKFRVYLYRGTQLAVDISGRYGDLYFTGGIATIELGHDEVAYGTDLPDNVTYKVVEDQDPDYITSVTSDSGDEGAPAQGVIKNNQSAYVTFLNHKNSTTGDLTVTKTTEGIGADLNKEFTFVITLSDTSVNGKYGDIYFENGIGKVKLSNGKSATAKGLPKDITYTVAEKDHEGYTVNPSETLSGSVTGKVEAAFTNTFDTGSLKVAKTTTGSGADENKKFSFTIELSQPISGTYGDLTFNQGTASFELSSGESVTATDLPAGVQYTVTESSDDSYTKIIPENANGSILKDYLLTTEFENSYNTGDLTISKTIAGSSIDAEKAFTFTVQLDPKLTGTYGDLTFDNNGSSTFTLKHNESKTVTDLPTGTTYTITELRDDKYTTVPDTNELTGEIETGVKKSEAFINTLKTGDLEISKEVIGTSTSKEFVFNIELSDVNIDGTYGDITFSNGRAEITLKSGETKRATGLPEGIYYSVTETEHEGFTVTPGEVISGIVGQENQGAVAFVNTFDSGDLILKKTVQGFGSDPNREFTFNIELSDKTINGIFGDISFTNGIATVKLSAGKELRASGLPAGISYKITEDEDERYQTVIPDNNSGLIIKDQTEIVEFTNIFKTGSFEITKRVDGTGADRDKEFSFTVTLTPLISGSFGDLIFENGISHFSIKDGETINVRDLPVGINYTISENEQDKYSSSIPDDGITGTILYGTNTTHSVANTFKTGDLEISKNVSGTTTNQIFIFTVILEDQTITGSYGEIYFTNGVAIVPVRQNETKVIRGLPYGIGYTITETDNKGFTVEPPEPITGNIGAQESKGFTNTLETGSLKIRKEVRGISTDNNREFNFTITLWDTSINETYNGVEFINGVGHFTLKDSEVKEINGLPASVGYQITEETGPGYSVYYGETGNSGHIVKNETITVDVVNTYSYDSLAVELEVLKTLKNNSSFVEGDYYNFLASITGNPEDGSTFEPINLHASSDANGNVFFTPITFTKPGIYQAKVSELKDNKTGVIYDESVYIITFTVIDDGTGRLSETRKITRVTDNQTVENVVFENEKVGDLTINKAVIGAPEVLEKVEPTEFTFNIEVSPEISGIYGDVEFVNGHATVTLRDGDTVSALGLPEGTYYKVTENENERFSSVISNDGEGNIVTGENQVVEVINTYIPIPTEVTLEARKVLLGEGLKDKEFSFSLDFEEMSDGFECNQREGTYNKADGSISFGTIKFTKEGTYPFQIREIINDSESNIDYDQSVYTIIYIVTEDENGQLVALPNVLKDEQIYEINEDNPDIVFVNSLPGDLIIEKNVEGIELPDTDPGFEFTITLFDGTNRADINDTFNDVTFINGQAKVTVKANESKEITGLRAGLNYSVEETPRAGFSVSYDETDDSSGTIEAGSSVTVKATNTYSTTETYITPEVRKAFSSGRELEDSDLFRFEMRVVSPEDGYEYSEDDDQITINRKSGIAKFSPIKITKAGVYQVEVHELQDNKLGIVYDSKVIVLEYTVTDNGRGELEAVLTKIIDKNTNEEIDDPVFINEEVGDLIVSKTVSGAPILMEGEEAPRFRFTVTTAPPIPDGLYGEMEFESGTAQFELAGGETKKATGIPAGTTYTVTEEQSERYASSIYSWTDEIKVGLSSIVNAVNTYIPIPVSVHLQAEKVLLGRDLEENEFSFSIGHEHSLTGFVHEGSDTVSNDSEGRVDFGTFTFTQPGTYTFWISELLGSNQSIVYDTSVYEITYQVTQNERGELVVSQRVTKDGQIYDTSDPDHIIQFKNILPGELKISKVVQGIDLAEADDLEFEFKITLYEGNEIADINGTYSNVTFTNGVATASLTHDQTILIQDLPAGLTYTVEETERPGYSVNYNEGAGNTGMIVPGETVEVNVVNTYHPNEIKIYPAVRKIIENRELTESDVYRFSMKVVRPTDEESYEYTSSDLTTTNTLDGNVVFSPVTIKKAGTYEIEIREADEQVPGLIYDDKVLVLIYTVTDNGNGELLVESTETKIRGIETDLPVEDATFVNKEVGDLILSKTAENVPDLLSESTERYFNFTITTNPKVPDGSYSDVEFSDGSAEVTLENGDTKTISGLPAGTVYEVKEKENERFSTVIENGTGTIVVGQAQTVSVVNTYIPIPVEVTPVAKKVLNGKILTEKEFAFEISYDKEQDGFTYIGSDVVNNDSEGFVKFGTITFTKPGKYEFRINEIESNVNIHGVTYDDSVYKLTYTVSVDAEGKLVAALSVEKNDNGYIINDPDNELIFENDLPGSLEIMKELEGNSSNETNKEFEFDITLFEGDQVAGVNGNYSDVSFSKGKATVKIAAGSKKQIDGLPAGLTYLVEEVPRPGYTVDYSQSYSSRGTIQPGAVANIKAHNSYDPSEVQVTLSGQKSFMNRELTDSDAFIFEMSVTGDNLNGFSYEQSRVINNSEGYFEFSPITFTEEGTYTITIWEVNDGKAGVYYDPTIYIITYQVSDNTEGALKAEKIRTEKRIGEVIETADNIHFTNEDIGNLLITKSVIGDPSNNNGEPFEFTIILHPKSETINGIFSGVTFRNNIAKLTLAGNSSYLIEGLPAGTEFEVTETPVKVNNKDKYTTTSSDEQGEIVVNDTQSVVFTNTYIPQPTQAIPIAQKILEGGKLSEGQFSFSIEPDSRNNSSGYRYNGNTTVTNDTNGSIHFGVIEFIEAGTYAFRIREIPGLTNGITYDSSYYDIVYSVFIDETTGDLDVKTAVIKNETTLVTSPTLSFTNKMPGSLEVTKTVDNKGDINKEFTFTVTLSDKSINGTYKDFEFKNGVAKISLKHGQTKRAQNLPAGITYTVTEEEVPGYSAEYGTTGNTGTILAGKQSSVTINNAYSVGEVHATPLARKSFSNKELTQGDIFSFKMTALSTNPTSGWSYANGNQIVYNNSAGLITFDTIRFTQAGTYRFRLEEVKYNKPGIEFDNNYYIVTYEVRDENKNGEFTCHESYSLNGTQAVDSADFVNTEVGDLVVMKAVHNAPVDFDRTFDFEVHLSDEFEINGTYGDMDFEDNVAKISLGANDVAHAIGLPVGIGYAVTEVPEESYISSLSTNNNYGSIGSSNVHEVKITNTYVPDPIEVPIEASKVLNGGSLRDRAFSFNIEVAGDPGSYSYEGDTIVQNDNRGKIDFGTVTFNRVGIYRVTITEIQGLDPNILYDKSSYDIIYNVYLDEDGELAYTKTVIKDNKILGSEAEVTFENSLPGNLKVTKTLSGSSAQTNQNFEFTVTLYRNQIIASDISGSYGDMVFNEGVATFTLRGSQSITGSDIPSDLTYVVSETPVPGYSVSYKDGGNSGRIESGKTSELEVINTYTDNKISTTPTAIKRFKNREVNSSDSFSFKLSITGNPSNGYEYDRNKTVGTNDSNGSIVFEPITFTQPGTYRVTITEVNNRETGIVYDTSSYEIIYLVTEEDSGELSLEKTINRNGEKYDLDDIFFINDEVGDLSITKRVVGNSEVPNENFEFTITLDADPPITGNYGAMTFLNNEAKVSIRSNGTVKAMNLPAGTGYTISETPVSGYVSSLDITNNKGVIEVGKEVNNTVTNTYTPDEITIVPEATKAFENRALTSDDIYSFELTVNGDPEDGYSYNRSQSIVSNDADGKIQFTPVTFTKEGTYTVTLRELSQNKSGIEFDNSIYEIIYTVFEGEDGKLEFNRYVTKDDKEYNGDITFINDEVGNLIVTKTVVGEGGDLNRDFNITVTLSEPLTGTYGEITFTDGIANFTLEHNEIRTATGLPVNITYTVSEENDKDYTASFVNNLNSGRIEVGKDSIVSIINSYNNKTDLTDLKIEKLQNLAGDEPTEDFIRGEVGDILTYTIRVTNPSDKDQNNLMVTDKVPTDATLIKESISDYGVFDPDSNSITWMIDKIRAGETRILTFDILLEKVNVTYSNKATVSSDETKEKESNTVVSDTGDKEYSTESPGSGSLDQESIPKPPEFVEEEITESPETENNGTTERPTTPNTPNNSTTVETLTPSTILSQLPYYTQSSTSTNATTSSVTQSPTTGVGSSSLIVWVILIVLIILYMTGRKIYTVKKDNK